MTPLDFLKAWSPEGPWALVASDKDHGVFTGETFKPAKHAVAVAWIEAHQGYGRNIYFHVNSLCLPVSPKASLKDVGTVDWFHVDIDPRVQGGLDKDQAREYLADEQVRILGLLTDNLPEGVPKPSVIVFSGGGYQAFWKIEEPIVIDGDVALAEDAKRYNKALEIALGADDCGNVDRIMRVPGTINFPDEGKRDKGRVKVQAELIQFNHDLVYPLSAFQQAGPPANADVTLDIGAPQSISTPAELDSMVTRKVKGWDKDLANAKAWLEGKEVKGVRSEPVHAFACACVRLGIPDEVVFGILQDAEWPISDSVRSHTRGAAGQAQREVERAHKAVGPLGDEQDDTEPVDLISLGPLPSNIPPRPWVIPGLLMDGQVTMLTGKGGEGKSIMGLQIAIACALNTTFAYWTPKMTRPTMIINFEDDRDEQFRRVEAACDIMKVDARLLEDKLFLLESSSMVFVTRDAEDKIVATDLYRAVQKLVEERDIGCIIIDPFVEAHTGLDENSNVDMKEAIVLLRKLARGRKIPILLIHHSRKGSANGDQDAARGGSSMVNACRVVLSIERMSDEAHGKIKPPRPKEFYVRVTDAKSNYAARASDRWLEMEIVDLANEIDTAVAFRGVVLDNFDDGFDAEGWEHRDTLLGLVERGRPDGKGPWSASKSGPKANRLNQALIDALGVAGAFANEIIKAFDEAGLIEKDSGKRGKGHSAEVWVIAQEEGPKELPL